MESKRILITSALPYVNNVPHLGNIIGCVLSADVFARYCRSRGHDSLYICGTDEYGTATEIKALEEGATPQQICDKYHAVHKGIYHWFGIHFDHFGRTSTPKHTEITQDIFLKLHTRGKIAEKEIEQYYDEKAGMFLADRYIEGTCPYCGSDGARGDQCDKCGKLLHQGELKDPVSKVTKTKPVLRRTRHLFIDLPKMEKELKAWVDATSKEGFWPENARTMALAWLREGLRQRAITRDLKWGVPVPIKGFESKVFYVWFDAPIGYISITAGHTPAWKEWWLEPDKVRLYQFLGKDNIPFHTVIFPAMLLGSGTKWTMLHHISTTEYLTYEGGKFSKSKHVGVFGDDAMHSGIAPDVWRYYLLANRPETSDSSFEWQDLKERNNSELLANAGNLVNRTLVFLERYFNSEVPSGKLAESDEKFLAEQEKVIGEVTELLEKVRLRDALHKAMHFSHNANKYFQDNKPWELVKKNDLRAGAVLGVLANQVKDLAILLEPYLPHTSAAIWKQLGCEEKKWGDLGKLSLGAGHRIGKPEILFRKLEDAEIAQLKAKFSGKAEDARAKAAGAMKEAGKAASGMEKSAGAKGTETKKEPKAGETNAITFADLDLEVGEVLSVDSHPDADKLYIERVRLGSGEIQVVSGLAPYISKDGLLGKKVIIVRNLMPAKLRGVESQGMLLVADAPGMVEVLECPGCEPGDKITAKGVKSAPRPHITIKEFGTITLEVKDGKVLADGKQLLAGKNPLMAHIVRHGKVC